MREFIEDEKLILYEIRKNVGFLRYIVMREGKFMGEFMVNFVILEGKFLESFLEYFLYVIFIYWSVNRIESDVFYGDVERYWGEFFIREKFDDVIYLIYLNSFF